MINDSRKNFLNTKNSCNILPLFLVNIIKKFKRGVFLAKEGNIIKSQNEESNSIEEICSSTWESIYRFIYYKVQNREEAEDITQETYVKALSYLQKNTKVSNYLGFLKTISLNVLRDRWRKNKRHGTVIDFNENHSTKSSIYDLTEAFAQRELIQNALMLLKKEHRTVIELRIIKGYTVAETSRIMNKNENSVRVLQYRALQHLARILKNEKEGRIENES